MASMLELLTEMSEVVFLSSLACLFSLEVGSDELDEEPPEDEDEPLLLLLSSSIF